VSDSSETVDDQVLRLRRQGQACARSNPDLGLGGPPTLRRRSVGGVRRLLAAGAEQVRYEDRGRQLKTIDRMGGHIQHDGYVRGSTPETNDSTERDST
jgi:hypothetical protein